VSTRGMSRNTDPKSSKAAAESILPRLSGLQQQVLDVLRERKQTTGDGMTDGELERPPQVRNLRFSTIRKRRTELMQKGFVRSTGRLREKMTVWEPIPLPEVLSAHEAKAAGRLFCRKGRPAETETKSAHQHRARSEPTGGIANRQASKKSLKSHYSKTDSKRSDPTACDPPVGHHTRREQEHVRHQQQDHDE